MCHEKKAQIYSLDFIAAVLVFTLALAFVAAFWQNSMHSARSAIARNSLTYSAIAASDMLVSSPGVPSDWEKNRSSMASIGLAAPGSENELVPEKIRNFTALADKTIQDKLGLRSGFYFYIEDMQGARLHQAGNSSISSERVVAIERLAVLEGKKAKVMLLVRE